MLASPNTILYAQEAVRFIGLNNILTTAFIGLESTLPVTTLFHLQSCKSNVCLLSAARFLGKGQPFMTQKTNVDNRGILLQQFQEIQKWNILYVGKKKKPWDNKCKEVFKI